MPSAAQPLFDYVNRLRQTPQRVENALDPYIHPILQMLGIAPQTAPAATDTRQMMNWTPQPNEEQLREINGRQTSPSANSRKLPQK